jgi:hypothetical protein
MRSYRYNFLDQNGDVQGAIVLDSQSDNAACELASDLLSSSKCAMVEVLEGERTIFQIGSNGTRARLSA